MTINKNESKKNVIELRKELTANGTTMENVYVGDQKFCCIGYVSEKDKQACLRAIQIAVDNSDSLYEAMMKLTVNANLTDAEVEPDEQIDFHGAMMFINYRDKAIYDSDGTEYVNCHDLDCELPKAACKEILIRRAEDKYDAEHTVDDSWDAVYPFDYMGL